MAYATMDTTFFKSTDTPARPELLVSAVLHLMSQYTNQSLDATPCVKLAAVIERHLQVLAERSDLAPVLRATCQQLSEQWAMVVDRALPPPPEKPGFLAQLFSARQPV